MSARAFRFGASSSHAGREAVQHPLDVIDAIEDGLGFVRVCESKVLCEVCLEPKFGRLASCEVERVKVLPVALPAAALGDVAANRDGRSTHLRRESKPFIRREGRSQSVDGRGERSRLLEDE